MAYVHVSHDCILRHRAILCHNIQMGGFTEIGESANIGLSTVIHQGLTIGAFAMVGMGSVITRDVPPFSKTYGNPAKVHGTNVIGLERAGFEANTIGEAKAFVLSGIVPQNQTLSSLINTYVSQKNLK